MENERSEPGHLKSGGVESGKWRIEKAGSPKNRQIFWGVEGECRIKNN